MIPTLQKGFPVELFPGISMILIVVSKYVPNSVTKFVGGKPLLARKTN
jgi:hypothetical protein